ncbi:MAG: hypothetical protein RQ736_08550 [Thiogranum sp.]|nr:hypothetical protein [Thiogranum sp.]
MRKHIIGEQPTRKDTPENLKWLDLEVHARAEITSEDPEHPFEEALRPQGTGWRAAEPGTQSLRLLFDEPVRIQHIRLVFRETETRRSQEFVLRWRTGTDPGLREIVRQQYNFSMPDSTEEQEDYQVTIEGLSELELRIVPDISGGPAHASLAQLRLA